MVRAAMLSAPARRVRSALGSPRMPGEAARGRHSQRLRRVTAHGGHDWHRLRDRRKDIPAA